MRSTLLLSISVLAITNVASAADTSNLNGTYGFTSSESCLVSALGFNSEFEAVGGSVWSSSSVNEGFRTFDGKGGGTVQGKGTGSTVPPTPGFVPGASSSEFTFSFTYMVSDDVWTTEGVAGTYKGTVLTGTRAGQTFTITGGPTPTGLMPADGKTLTLATVDPRVEVIAYSNGNSYPRICHRTQVLIKLDNE
jgi:hypothetical protein